MAYLRREERRIEILEGVIRVAERDGFAGATVRSVSKELRMSAGNIHHVFASAAQLKREAFRYFAERELAAMDAYADKLSPEEQLLGYLSLPALDKKLAIRRLWTSAVLEGARDAAFAVSYAEAAVLWHDRVSNLLLALAAGRLSRKAADDAAWRLMGFSVGIGSFLIAGPLDGSKQVIGYLRTLITRELSQSTGESRGTKSGALLQGDI